MRIRHMTESDLTFAENCTRIEGWLSDNRVEFDNFLACNPHGCFLAEEEGIPIGICVATQFQQAGFIGDLILLEAWRGCGRGAQLFNHAVAYLQSQGVESIYLDGVVPAVSLYERAGFRKICRSRRLYGRLNGKQFADVRPMNSEDLSEVIAFDHACFGAERGFFLERRWKQSPELCMVTCLDGVIMGYIMGRRSEIFSIGPWIAANSMQEPLRLLQQLAYENPHETFHLGVLETNHRAMQLLHGLSFEETPNPPWRMVLGESGLGEYPACLTIGTSGKG